MNIHALGNKAVIKDFGPQTECVYVFCVLTTNRTAVMHRYEILPPIWLADIEIHIITDTDNQSDVIFTKIPQVFGKIVILKTLFWS